MSNVLNINWILTGLVLAAVTFVAGCGEQHVSAQSDNTQSRSEPNNTTRQNTGNADNADLGIVQMSDQQIAQYDITLAAAEAGTVPSTLSLPGEVVFNPDRIAHVTPRVPGVVRDVTATIGDQVQAGDVLAILDSRELAQAKSAYLAAQSKLGLAKANFEREKKLFEQEIAPEAEFLQSRQRFREAEVNLRLAERELHALGLDEAQVEALPDQPENELTRYELIAPIGGTIVQRHVAKGETLHAQPSEPPFVIADASQVWVELTVYPKNLGQVRNGQKATIEADNTDASATGKIDYVSPRVRQSTRTATARVVLDNKGGVWRPGQFVTGQVHMETAEANVVIPESAIQTVDQQPVVFVRSTGGFTSQKIKIGQRGGGEVSIQSGLEPGQRYAAGNTFILKAELKRGN
jgi:cobalt-zinc-cadmium efflux system membrane fusion protein